jgi:hypothetical protein
VPDKIRDVLVKCGWKLENQPPLFHLKSLLSQSQAEPQPVSQNIRNIRDRIARLPPFVHSTITHEFGGMVKKESNNIIPYPTLFLQSCMDYCTAKWTDAMNNLDVFDTIFGTVYHFRKRGVMVLDMCLNDPFIIAMIEDRFFRVQIPSRSFEMSINFVSGSRTDVSLKISNIHTNLAFAWTQTTAKIAMRYDAPTCKYSSVTMFNEDLQVSCIRRYGIDKYTFYQRKEGIDHAISRAMMTGADGLRYRGTCTETRQTATNRVMHRQVKCGDEIVYDEKDETVCVDKIRVKTTGRPEWLTGWKLVKNERGAHRVLKIAIPPDATVVCAVDSDHLVARQKKRCDRCMVVDLQYPKKDEEVSVVPAEKTAVSCVYTETAQPFVYVVGQIAEPHAFSDDTHEGCAPGIHFFTDRSAIFETYLIVEE